MQAVNLTLLRMVQDLSVVVAEKSFCNKTLVFVQAELS